MKASNYLVKYIDDESYVVLSTKTRKILRFPLEEKDYVDSALDGNVDALCSEIKYMLSDEGFLVSEDTDEFYEMKQKRNELVNSDTLYLTIMSSYTCNLACIYCFQHHKQGAVMNFDTANSIINFVRNNINKYKAVYVEWFGGEPLIAKEQVIFMNSEICKICRENKKPYVSRMTTNGYELDLETFNKLQKYNCLVYYVSVDCGKEMHDIQRPLKNGSGSYDRIMANLKTIKDRALSRNFRVEIRVNCSSKAYRYLEDFLVEVEKSFGGDQRFSLVIDAVKDWSERTKEMKQNEELIGYRGVADLSYIAKKYHVNLASVETHALDTQICQAAKRNAYIIHYDGSLHKCQMAMEADEYRELDKIGEITAEGNLQIDTEKEKYWVKDVFQCECEQCALLPLCLGTKCVFQTEIKGEECEKVIEKFINEFKVHEMSKLENIRMISIKNGRCIG